MTHCYPPVRRRWRRHGQVVVLIIILTLTVSYTAALWRLGVCAQILVVVLDAVAVAAAQVCRPLPVSRRGSR